MMVAEIRRGIGLNCSALKVPASTSHSRQCPTYIGTRNYFEKFDFHESWVSESDSFMTSKLGLGTYIGDFSDEQLGYLVKTEQFDVVLIGTKRTEHLQQNMDIIEKELKLK